MQSLFDYNDLSEYMLPPLRSFAGLLLVYVMASPVAIVAEPVPAQSADSSGVEEEFSANGPLDGDRFTFSTSSAWKGVPNAGNWWWQVRFGEVEKIGAILQIQGDHNFVFSHAPRQYVWQASLDGQDWQDLRATKVTNEQRVFRIHRLAKAVNARFLRIQIDAATGAFPTCG